MASLVQCLRANKISLNTKKIEKAIFKTLHTYFSKNQSKTVFNNTKTYGYNLRSVTYNNLTIPLK